MSLFHALPIAPRRYLFSEGELQSLTIDWLRMPLALAVVFIHNNAGNPPDIGAIHANPWTMEHIYDLVRIAGSNVLFAMAVPTFFMFSGYLFFCKITEWNAQVYSQKLRSRFRSLLIPYLVWILISILHTELFKLGGVILHDKPWSGMTDYLVEHGCVNMMWNSQLWGG